MGSQLNEGEDSLVEGYVAILVTVSLLHHQMDLIVRQLLAKGPHDCSKLVVGHLPFVQVYLVLDSRKNSQNIPNLSTTLSTSY